MLVAGPASGKFFALCLVLMGLILAPLGANPARAQEDPVKLMEKILALTKEGKLDEAIKTQLRLAAIIEKMGGKRHPLYANQIAQLGDLHSMKGDYAASERHFRDALKLRQEILGPEHADVAAMFAKLGDLYITTAQYEKAESHLQRAIAIRRKTLKEADPDYGMTMISLGRLAHQRSRFADAERAFRQAMGLFQRHLPPDHPYIPLAQNNLAEVLRALGHHAEAERLLREALAGNERTRGADSYFVAPNLNNLAELMREQGRFGEAEQFGRRATAIVEKTLGPDHPTMAVQLNNLGLFLIMRGRAEEAISVLRRTLQIQRKTYGAEHHTVAAATHLLAEALAGAGKADEAETLYRQALAMRERLNGPEGLPVAYSLSSMTTFLHKQDRTPEAEPLARRALAIRQANLPPDHPLVAESLSTLAVLLDELGRHGDARPFHERAAAITRTAFGEAHPNAAIIASNLAHNLADSGEWAAAHAMFRQAGQIWTARHAATQDGAPSVLASEADRELRENASPFLGQVRAGYELWLNAPASDKPGLMEESFAAHQWASLSSAGSAVAKMSARIAAGSGPLSALVREQQDLTARLAALDKSLVAAMSSDPAARNAEAETDLRGRAEAVRRRLGALAGELSARFPDFAALASPRPIGIAQVKRALGPKDALYTITTTRHGSFVWVVTRDAERWLRIAPTTLQLAEEVAALRCGLDLASWDVEGKCERLTGGVLTPADRAAGRLPPFDLARAHRLYQALLAPVADLIAGRQLIVVPTGPLTQLPFHVLVAGDAPPVQGGPDAYRRADWLLRHVPITVLPAVSSLGALSGPAGQGAARQAYLGIGNPLLDGPDERYAPLAQRARASQSCGSLERPTLVAAVASRKAGEVTTTGGIADIAYLRSQSPLPETTIELCAVAEALGAGTDAVRLGSAATETAIKRMNEQRELARYRTLHFATHGALAGEAVGASEPGLLLTPPPKASQADDGYLSASEIGALQLDADLVILSACNTAAGGAGDSDTLAGLARSFFYAGARSLMVSHWAVYSDPTVKLITAALSRRAKDPGLAYPEALRLAMLSLIESGSAADAHPVSWAPFVVVGAPGNGAGRR